VYVNPTRRISPVVLALALVVGAPVGGGLRAQVAAPKASFDRLYRDYAAGDRGIVRRSVQTGGDVRALQPPMDAKKLQKWLGPWDRTKAAFLLEFADAETELSAHLLTAVSAGRLYVMDRPRPLGQDAAEDAFETAWHKAAIALLQERINPQAQDAYLDVLERRYLSGASPRPPRLDPRFALDRGIAQEQRCALAGSPPASCLREVVRRYAVAAAAPETAAEANVRAAWALFQLRSYADALQTVDRACPTDDRDVTYWTHLFRGRILEALDRTADAEREYRAALDIRPFAQSAAVAVAMTLFKLNRPDEAVAAARAARQQPPDFVDPWWIYLRGDARFIPQWRTELRSRIKP